MCELTSAAEVVIGSAGPASRTARHFVEDALCRVQAAPALTECMLAGSELATEALRTGGVPLAMSLDCWESAVVVTITDRARFALDIGLPECQSAMLVLDRLTLASSREPAAGGRLHWAMLSTAGAAPAAPR